VAKAWYAETSEVCADGAPVVSLNKIEALIAEGEKIPVEFSEVSNRFRRVELRNRAFRTICEVS
jgi:hypothetical protein